MSRRKSFAWRGKRLMNDLSLPADTTLEALRVQHAVYRRMPAERRLRQAFAMTASARALAAAGVRSRHPGYSERQIRLAVFHMTLGEELFRLTYPGEDVRP